MISVWRKGVHISRSGRPFRADGDARPAADPSFDDETWPERYREYRFWLWVFLAFTSATLGLSAIAMPEQLGAAVIFRFCIVAPLSLAGIRLLARRRPPWLESLACVLPYVATLVGAQVLFALDAKLDATRAIIVLTFDIMARAFLVPMRPGQVVTLALVSLILGDACIAAGLAAAHAPVTRPDVIIFGHAMAVLSVIGRVRAERRMRATFLKGLALRRRTDELSRVNERLAELSTLDPLTGVANRRSYDTQVSRLWREAASSESALALLMIDVDRFKAFNDTLGHQRGDDCLVLVARTIAGQIREGNDFLGRFGGEEFVVLLPGLDLPAAKEVAERICVAVAGIAIAYPAGLQAGSVTVSIGVAANDQFPRGDAADLLAGADVALYAAKRGGRNRVCCHADSAVPRGSAMSRTGAASQRKHRRSR